MQALPRTTLSVTALHGQAHKVQLRKLEDSRLMPNTFYYLYLSLLHTAGLSAVRGEDLLYIHPALYIDIDGIKRASGLGLRLRLDCISNGYISIRTACQETVFSAERDVVAGDVVLFSAERQLVA